MKSHPNQARKVLRKVKTEEKKPDAAPTKQKPNIKKKKAPLNKNLILKRKKLLHMNRILFLPLPLPSSEINQRQHEEKA